MSVAQQLAARITATRYEDLTPEVNAMKDLTALLEPHDQVAPRIAAAYGHA